jgi:hypothetical protein
MRFTARTGPLGANVIGCDLRCLRSRTLQGRGVVTISIISRITDYGRINDILNPADFF